MATTKPDNSILSSLIINWKLNKTYLAARMKMPAGTFKNKLSETQTAYKFTGEEARLLEAILIEMSADIRNVSSMTYKQAKSIIENRENEYFEELASEAEYKRHFK